MKNSNYYFLSLTVLGIFLFSSFKKSYPPVEVPSFDIEVKIEAEKTEKKLNKYDKRRLLVLEAIDKVSKETGTPPELLEAICRVESNLNPYAFKRNDGGRKNHAFGACQVLRRTGEALLETRDKGCDRDFQHVAYSQRTKKNCFLFDPYNNVKAAALYLKKHIARYDSLEDVVAGYNAGSAKRKKTSGQLINEGYVKKVYHKLGLEKPAAAEITARG